MSVDALASAPRSGWWSQRVAAWLLGRSNPAYDTMVHYRKRALFGDLEGTVVELGPGAGANLPYLSRATRWIGVEPNPYLHGPLRATAAQLGRPIEIVDATAERLPFADRSVDAVMSSLVLCSVDDVEATLREVRRVLRPGGRFAFLEHVAAPRGTRQRVVQRLARPLWRALGDGCHPDRELSRPLAATGFASLTLDRFDLPLAVIGPHLMGVAIA